MTRMAERPAEVDPVITRAHTYASVSTHINRHVRKPVTRTWFFGFAIAFSLLMLFNAAVTWLLIRGVGIWGVNIPVGWGMAITNFVWWIGIGHAGTFISAFLLLLRQEWRTSINRFAEAMTLFAVACAGMFPLLHLGRPWLFYFLFPYPNTMDLWPQFRSPLIWDVFAVSTYGTVSLVFWYVGLIPDLATLRDSAGQSNRARKVYGFFALGWRGAARHWERYHKAYLLLAGLAAPLVISVHSVVGMDFAAGIVPGWHSTIFPPYFVAGAIFSGFAMVVTLAVPLRSLYGLKDLITLKHLDNCAKLMLVTGLIVAYGYYVETFLAWYSGSGAEMGMMSDRYFGRYWPLWWGLLFCNVVVPQFFWFRGVRRSPWGLFGLSLLINVGMWLERFIIVIQSLHHDYLPSAWEIYYPTVWDWATFIGTMGLFLTLFLLFCRYLPVIAVAEMRELVHRVEGGGGMTTGAFQAKGIYGVAAEFDTPEALMRAAEEVAKAGYTQVEAYSPFVVEGMAEVLGTRRNPVGLITLVAGMIGGATGFGMCWYANVWSYPLNIGGRPLNSWPAWIPITFELTVLFAALSAAIGMLILNGLPRLHHPVFEIPGFERASRDRFFLCVEAEDPRFEMGAVRKLLGTVHALAVTEVLA